GAVRIDREQLPAHELGDCLCVHAGANHHTEVVGEKSGYRIRNLRHGAVERRKGFFSERVVLYAWHNSNDFVIAIGRNVSKRYAKVSANRVRIREEAPRQRFVNYDDTSALLCVVLGEIAAAQQRHMHGCEVPWRDPTMLGTRHIT